MFQAFCRRVKASRKPGYPQFRKHRRTVKTANPDTLMVQARQAGLYVSANQGPAAYQADMHGWAWPDRTVLKGIPFIHKARRVKMHLPFTLDTKPEIQTPVNSVGIGMGMKVQAVPSAGPVLSERPENRNGCPGAELYA